MYFHNGIRFATVRIIEGPLYYELVLNSYIIALITLHTFQKIPRKPQ